MTSLSAANQDIIFAAQQPARRNRPCQPGSSPSLSRRAAPARPRSPRIWRSPGRRRDAASRSSTSIRRRRSPPGSSCGASGGRATEPDIAVTAITGWRVATEVERQARDHDIVLVDSPPHAATEARMAVRAASLALVPVQPSPMDLWATRATLELARAERVPALLVLNRVPPRANLTKSLLAEFLALNVPMAQTQIGNRVALAAVARRGQGHSGGLAPQSRRRGDHRAGGGDPGLFRERAPRRVRGAIRPSSPWRRPGGACRCRRRPAAARRRR